MQYNELISVIVPVYNVETYLNRCVDSIIGQTYKNIEIILIDDGSTDASPRLCDDYLHIDNRIVVIHQENKGLSSARNVGIKIAKGKYLSFVDSDDYIDKHFIDRMYTTITAQSSDIVICDIRSFDSQTLQFLPHTRDIGNSFVDIGHIFETMMQSDYPWLYTMSCNKLYSRQIFNEACFLDGFIHEDEIIFLDIVKQSPKVFQINESLYFYCKNRDGSIVNKKYSIKRFDIFIAFYNRIEYFKQNGFNKKLIINECRKIFRKLKRALYKLHFEEFEEIELYQNELKKAANKCIHSLKCLRMYLSIILSKKYREISRKKKGIDKGNGTQG